MKRLTLALVLGLFMLVPIGSASASHCATIDGSGRADFGNGVGSLRVALDGEAVKVPFVYTGFEPTGENTADIFIDFFFPHGVVSVVEHSTSTQLGGAVNAFEADVEVLAGGSGGWTWSGIANVARGLASIQALSGELCTG